MRPLMHEGVDILRLRLLIVQSDERILTVNGWIVYPRAIHLILGHLADDKPDRLLPWEFPLQPPEYLG